MPTPVEISFVKMGDGYLGHRIAGLGGLSQVTVPVTYKAKCPRRH